MGSLELGCLVVNVAYQGKPCKENEDVLGSLLLDLMMLSCFVSSGVLCLVS